VQTQIYLARWSTRLVLKKKTKLWQEASDLDQLVERFTIGRDNEFDLILAEYDVIGSLAHGTMLNHVGLLTSGEWLAIRTELLILLEQIRSDNFEIESGVEDIHSQIELVLTRKLGDAGKKIHTGRSRNDQVLLDLHLYTRVKIRDIVASTSELFDILITLSDRHKHILMPGYTHTQVAMPSSFGLWFAAYAESLIDDLIQVQAAYHIINKNPLGSAAGYGSSLPLDRELTTRLLGFGALNINSLYAQMGRGKTERVVLSAIASLAETLGRFAADIILFLSQNFAFISFPDTITTGSSIMPHKKNPDIFELLRARCNRIRALPTEINMITANLSSGYHRDLQILKEMYMPALIDLKECLAIMIHILPRIQVSKEILDNTIYRDIYSVEAVNQLVLKGMSFRDAYHQVKQSVQNVNSKKPDKVLYTHTGSINNLQNEQIRRAMTDVLQQFEFTSWQKAIDNLTFKS